MSNRIDCGDHKGLGIKFDPSNFRFVVEEGLEDGNWYESLEKAKEAIDRQHAAEAKASISGLKVSIPAITEKGESLVVTGVNRANGNVSVTGYREKSYSGLLYPNVPGVKEAVAELVRLEGEVKALRNKLRPINGSRSYGFGRLKAHQYPAALEKLEKEFEQAVAHTKL